MAAPAYSTDLTLITDGESGTWTELTNATNGGTPQVNTTEWYIQGLGCVTASMNNKTTLESIGYDVGTPISISAGDCFFMWHVCLAPTAAQTFAAGGLRMAIGSSTSDYYSWITGGSDFPPNPYGGWKNVAVDPTYTPVDFTEGTPTAGTYQVFASMLLPSGGVSKGEMHCVDAIRWGRGQLLATAGDLANGYATFAGMSAYNDLNTTGNYNRFGLLQNTGSSYLWKGLMSLGSSGTAVDFRDSNRNIIADNTPRTYAAFNKIEINNASSRVDWTGVNISALVATQLSRGNFEVIDNADVNFETCQFTDMNTFIFQSNSTINNTVFRRCGLVTQGGAVFDGCEFVSSTNTPALLVSNLDNIDNCDFTSAGTGHAIELTAAHAGGSYTLAGCTFTGYGSTGTTDAAIYNNSGGAVTIGVGTGQIPTYFNGSGASTTITGSVPIFIAVEDTDGVAISSAIVGIYANDDDTEIYKNLTDVNGEVNTSYSGTTPRAVRVWIRKASGGATKYINYSSSQTIAAVTGLSLSVTMREDPNNNATA